MQKHAKETLHQFEKENKLFTKYTMNLWLTSNFNKKLFVCKLNFILYNSNIRENRMLNHLPSSFYPSSTINNYMRVCLFLITD